MNKKILIGIIAISVALVMLGAGVLIGMKIPRKVTPLNYSSESQEKNQNQDNTFQAGWGAAQDRLRQSAFGELTSDGMESFIGIIQKIDENKLIVKVDPLEPISSPDLDSRIVIIDVNTKITLAVQKDHDQLQKEMRELQEKMKNSQQQSAIPLEPFARKEVSLSELKENQPVEVMTDKENRDRKELTAVRINIQGPAQ